MDIYETMQDLIKDLIRAYVQNRASYPYASYVTAAHLLNNTYEFDEALEQVEYLGDFAPLITWSNFWTNGEIRIAIENPWTQDFLDDALQQIFETKIQEKASELSFAEKYLDEFAGQADPTDFLEKSETRNIFEKTRLELNMPKLVAELTKFVERAERESQ